MSKILVGSSYFFSQYEDFQSKDIDEVEILEDAHFNYMRQITGQGRCLFQLCKHSQTAEYIEQALKSPKGMVVGKFLVPEFCQAIGFGIQDLPCLSPLIDRLDTRHMYEAVIFNSYLQNGDFVLTESQRREAYQVYKMSRRNIYQS